MNMQKSVFNLVASPDHWFKMSPISQEEIKRIGMCHSSLITSGQERSLTRLTYLALFFSAHLFCSFILIFIWNICFHIHFHKVLEFFNYYMPPPLKLFALYPFIFVGCRFWCTLIGYLVPLWILMKCNVRQHDGVWQR